MLSISGHKLHAPKGIGVLYIRKGTRFSPFMIGATRKKGEGEGQRMSLISSVLGMPASCQKHLNEENTRIKALRDYLEAKLLEKIPNTLVNGDRSIDFPIPWAWVSNMWRENRFSFYSPTWVSVPLRVLPAHPVPLNLRMSSGPWVFLLLRLMVRSVSVFLFTTRKKKWITSSSIFRPSFRDWEIFPHSGKIIWRPRREGSLTNYLPIERQ